MSRPSVVSRGDVSPHALRAFSCDAIVVIGIEVVPHPQGVCAVVDSPELVLVGVHAAWHGSRHQAEQPPHACGERGFSEPSHVCPILGFGSHRNVEVDLADRDIRKKIGKLSRAVDVPGLPVDLREEVGVIPPDEECAVLQRQVADVLAVMV